jgi:hypothetical protein
MRADLASGAGERMERNNLGDEAERVGAVVKGNDRAGGSMLRTGPISKWKLAFPGCRWRAASS